MSSQFSRFSARKKNRKIRLALTYKIKEALSNTSSNEKSHSTAAAKKKLEKMNAKNEMEIAKKVTFELIYY